MEWHNDKYKYNGEKRVWVRSSTFIKGDKKTFV